MENVFNILLCIDDFKGDYTRHCAVTMLSVLETNKSHKIKFFIMSSGLPQKNILELKRIVKMYDQEIEFIIHDDIIPENIKELFIHRFNLPWGTFYRLFFPLYIKNIDRLLYLDCDVLVTKDISDIYNMDMKGKAIAGYYDIDTTRFVSEYNFGLKQYINAGVLLIDVKKFIKYEFTESLIESVNAEHGQYLNCSDQDYINIIFKDDIYVYKKLMNFMITSKFFNLGLDKALIVHCLNKPCVGYKNIPKKLVKYYNSLLDLTKWRGYPEQKSDYGYFKHLFLLVRNFFFRGFMLLLSENTRRKIVILLYKILWKNKIKEK